MNGTCYVGAENARIDTSNSERLDLIAMFSKASQILLCKVLYLVTL